MTKYVIAAMAVCMSMAGAEVAMAECARSDFNVENFDVEVQQCSGRRCPRLRVTGTLVNNCSSEAAAQVEIQALDGGGGVVTTVEGWPAATANLAPGEQHDFDFGPMMRYNSNMAEFSVAITDVQVW
ncbi:hypothetical protein IC757_09220 [Wenzhouxiangella sp. AB-CW3]|uniref:hypothetical protein n=1 Tax=Wenzhouxiangella sp. AB-CW3 TaxID=2771012 RepID=UPI00168A8708|nr:hypothetical protein [Wenzhouxiangella sp. AB-CW3]QOC21235.1 hypothetical protein IC757_09220 [Wenzhouxiangella sp. AB-CW3]